MVRDMSKSDDEGITAREYLTQALKANDGHSLSSISKAAKVPLSTLRSFMRTPKAVLSVPTAKRLHKWSNGKISVAKTVGAV